jgi:hypothetical protein
LATTVREAPAEPEFEAKNNRYKRQLTEIVASRIQFPGTAAAKQADAAVVEEPPAPPEEEVPF